MSRNEDSGPSVYAPNRIKGHSEPQVRETTRNEVQRQDVTRTDNRTENRVENRIDNRIENRTEIRSPDIGTRSSIVDRHSTSRAPSVGMYRKDYADLGQIWKDRSEKRDTYSDRRDRGYDKDHHNQTQINFNFFSGSYRHYCFDYDPWYSYPSAYCYYYGLFPPYVRSYRVVWIAPNVGIIYTWVELPMRMVYWDYGYYPAYPGNDYYLSGWRYRSLSSALKDIQRAWSRSDVDLLMEHVRSDAKIDVFLKDEYSYTVDRQDYFDMTRDAMSNIRTVSFEFYRTRQRNGGEIVTYAKHTYYDDYYDGKGNFYPASKKSNVYLSYTLERSGDSWYITEVGSSPTKLH